MNDLNQNNIYDIQEKALDDIDQESLMKAEADTFWCLNKLIDDIQDNYTEL